MIGNVASRFQHNMMIQAKDIDVFMTLVKFLAFSWRAFVSDHAQSYYLLLSKE